ncbi:4-coumarate--CoA ligase-like 5 [Vanrija pseudolonga]|uniref:4-coumarate--CoA ligase-like 5 n=1 Tax=Vanrija pseudolonga TaxID=143232 RepID=A0AAF0YGR8_9TREE|nr:4-coumarate--CoA ligase-like 5 [Vanrija pseudolonga]
MGKQTIYETTYAHAPLKLPKLGLFEYLVPQPGRARAVPEHDPSLPAYIDGLDGRVLSRADIVDGALRLVTGLRGLGIKRGDTACLWGLNSLEWVQAAYGLMAAGVTISPANAAYAPHEIAYQVNNSDSQIIFLHPDLLPVFDKAREELQLPFKADRVVLLTPASRRKPEHKAYKTVHELFGAPSKAERFDGDQVFDTQWLCYSSGTTGFPKGVMTTHNNMTSQLEAVEASYGQFATGKNDVVLGFLPMSHIYGLTMVLLQPWIAGIPVVVLPRFEEVAALNAIQKYKVTHALVVPPVIILLLHSANVPKYDLSSLKTLMCGAAPLSGELHAMFTAKMPAIKLTQGYGMTECTPVVHATPWNESEGRGAWTGRLIPTYQARLVKEDGEDAAEGERGELWVRGPSVMKGYHKNPEATEKTMAPGGWYKTGDVLIVDDVGFYMVVDRLKELIKYKGFQVPPAELEALLLSHPKIVDAGVVGVWDESQATELPRGYIVPAPSANATTEAARHALRREVDAWVAARVAPHKRLRGGVVLVDAIPKSPSGKILRKDLRARATQEFEGEKAEAKL